MVSIGSLGTGAGPWRGTRSLRVLLRYVQTRSAVLRPRSVESLVNDLLLFAEYLTASQPGIASLRQLRRDHVESYLTSNRTRPPGG
jgi:hypothetical protein